MPRIAPKCAESGRCIKLWLGDNGKAQRASWLPNRWDSLSPEMCTLKSQNVHKMHQSRPLSSQPKVPEAGVADEVGERAGDFAFVTSAFPVRTVLSVGS